MQGTCIKKIIIIYLFFDGEHAGQQLRDLPGGQVQPAGALIIHYYLKLVLL